MSSLSCYIFSCMCKWSGLEENHSGGGLFEHDCLATKLSLAFVQCSTCIGQDIGATHSPFETRVMSCLCPIQCTKALVKTQTLTNYPITLGLIIHVSASTLGHKLFKFGLIMHVSTSILDINYSRASGTKNSNARICYRKWLISPVMHTVLFILWSR